MRAPLLAIALLSVAGPSAHSSAPPASPLLVVLRSACHPIAADLFSETALLDYFGSALHSHRPTRILSRNETCGPRWRDDVARGALSALSGGSAVAFSGWPGAAACEALGASARTLRVPQPPACARPTARAAVVVRLAVHLRWRQALLPSSPADLECASALEAIARALPAAGVAVQRAVPTPDEIPRDPHVVILCASPRAVDEAALAATGDRSSVLLVQVEESGTPAASVADTVSIEPTDEAFHSSNIILDLRTSPYVQKRDISSPTPFTLFSKSFNLSFGDQNRYKKSFPTPSSVSSSANKMTGFPDRKRRNRYDLEKPHSTLTTSLPNEKVARVIKKGSLDIPPRNNDTRSEKQTFTKNKIEDEPRPGAIQGRKQGGGRKRRQHNFADDSPSKTFSSDNKQNLYKSMLHRLSKSFANFHRQLLLLTMEDVANFEMQISKQNNIYEEILETLNKQIESTATKKEMALNTFYLHERVGETDSLRWNRVAILETTSTRSLDDYEDWETFVKLKNSSGKFESWSESRAFVVEYETGSRGVVANLIIVCSVLATMGACALGARLVARRRRRRRRRGDVVLAATEFVFPADDRRRVGEGMETMLSCWLQQLHEFGGPELERPDLLKQPPCVPPTAPSAPSSTCSVNRIATDRRTKYKGDAVQMKYVPVLTALELKRKSIDVLLVMQSMRHENLNPFIGCLCEMRPSLVWDHCGRGSLEDVLMADDIKLDWTFRLSLLTDLVKGMRYIHGSPLRVHGRLTSRNCVVDSRWVLRITDYGLPSFCRAQGLAMPPRSAREMLWSAPELLRESRGNGGRGSQPGDVFSFAIIMQEVIVRGEPYCMLSLTPDEIIEKLSRPPPLIRPSVSMGAAPPEAVSVMRQCWSEAPDLRPDFHRLYEIFRHLHRGRKINIVDSMFEMLEKYSNNLEELIKERTEQLDMEKKKTEQLLNRMLPRSVAERLLLGSRVEPEEFEEVSIYFSDIVGFTALAARSTPVQVVDLLNDLYTTFDAAIEQYRVYKVETIGDAYMVVGGLPVRTRDHAESVATMALHLLHLAGRFRIRHLPATPLHLRIGLHTGPCCAGVVGLTMPRYCLFGDTVNTASRMESTGAAWRIQVSAATFERLSTAGGYSVRSRGLVQIKGKGAMHTYWLLGKDGFDKPLPTPPPLQSEEVLFEAEGESESDASSTPSLPTATTAATASTATASATMAPLKSIHSIERQRSDPTTATTPDKYASWQRSGATSADSSPPRVPLALIGSTASIEQSAPYSRYRCMGGRRVLRRQWSLERGDAMAAAAGARPAPAEPLALLVPSVPRPSQARYRTRPEAPTPNGEDA